MYYIFRYEFAVTGKNYDSQVKDNPEVKVSKVKDVKFTEIRYQLAAKKKVW